MESTGAVNRVCVLGGGSAGLLSALALRTLIPRLDVSLVYSSDLGVIGVGEGTTAAVPHHLHGVLGIDPGEFYRQARPTPKLGIRFIWGPRPYYDYTFSGRQMEWTYDALSKPNGFYCAQEMECVDLPSALMSANKAFCRNSNGDPAIAFNLAYHMENEKLVGFLQRIAAARGVRQIDATVERVVGDQAGVSRLQTAAGESISADLFIDASGFRSQLLGREMAMPFVSFKPTLLCDRAIVGSWQRTDEPIQPYTLAETMAAGWCWRIDHFDSIARGYVYSSNFISDEAAHEEFLKMAPLVKSTRVVKFISGRYANSWSKNVVAIGNASGFVEPLEATSLTVICDQTRFLCGLLQESDLRPTESTRMAFNKMTNTLWDQVRQFLGIHYKFNRRLDTPFWRACRADTDIGDAQALVDYYTDHGPVSRARQALLLQPDPFGMEGYLSHLVGQQVPTRTPFTPTPHEQSVWRALVEVNRRTAADSLDVRESYQRIMSPSWRWDPSLYGGRRQVQGAIPGAMAVV